MDSSEAMTPRQKYILAQLIRAVQMAGRTTSERVLGSMAVQVAKSLKCRDDMLERVFEKALELADVPTIRVLLEAEKNVFRDMPRPMALTYEPDGTECRDRQRNYNRAIEYLNIGTRLRNVPRNLNEMLRKCYDTVKCPDLRYDDGALRTMINYCRTFCEENAY